MAWVRFWYASRCPSGNNPQESRYEWFDNLDDVSDSRLKELADDRVPSNLTDSERGYRFGFERLESLPEEARVELEEDFKAQRRYVNSMLRRLKKA